MKAKNTNNNIEEKSLVISYLTLRRAVGILGIALPIILALGYMLMEGDIIFRRSISQYYYTRMANAMVGILSAVGLFLFSYRGYTKWDNRAGDLACLFALGVAFFPCSEDGSNTLISNLHHISAALLFLTLSYFSLVLFPKTEGDESPKRAKKKRNKVYVVCGITMLVSIAFIGALAVFPKLATILEPINPVFWLESIALWAFGTSWITKGQMIWRDVEEE